MAFLPKIAPLERFCLRHGSKPHKGGEGLELPVFGFDCDAAVGAFSRVRGKVARVSVTEGGGRLHGGWAAPSTTLRVVPLPRTLRYGRGSPTAGIAGGAIDGARRSPG